MRNRSTYDEVVATLDSAVASMEHGVEGGSLDEAERERIRAKASMRELTEKLEAIGGALAELTLSFSAAAKTPASLKTQ